MKTYFTADLHFGHRKIIELCNRPFNSIEEHDEALIEYWNKIVKKEDEVFILGDFALSPFEYARKIRFKLNGRIFYIEGNHDKIASKLKDTFKWYKQTCLIKREDTTIWLSHYPHMSWPKSIHGSYHLYGHVHGRNSGSEEVLNRLMYDVGVDKNQYSPVSLEKIKIILDTRKAINSGILYQ